MKIAAYHIPGIARLIFPALSGFVAGTALQLQQAALYSWQAYGCFVLLVLVIWAVVATKTIASHWKILLTALALGCLAFGVTGLRASVFSSEALDAGLEGRDIAVTGVIAAMPQRNEAGLRFRLDVDSARLLDKPVHLPPRIYLGWYSGVFGGGGAGMFGELQRQPAPIEAGERWQMTVRLKAPHGARNPHGFDYELWLWEQDLQATGYVRAGPKDPVSQRLGQTGWHPVERARQQVRDLIFERVTERKYAGLIAALVVGDQNAIDRADWDIFRATGVAHLMSISGLHVTMFAWLAALALGWLWRRSERLCLWVPAPSAALLGGVVLATVYAVFSGWGVPSQRTVLMLATVCLLRLSGKQWPWPHVWLLACAAVVAMDPWALLQAGFWLSFVAVGVLFATDTGARPTKKVEANGVAAGPPHPSTSSGRTDRSSGGSAVRVATSVEATVSPPGRPQGETTPSGGSAVRVATSVGAMLREQWIITLALTPLTLLLFGQVSIVGLVANALAIPWVTLVVTPLAMLGVIVPPLWDMAVWAVAALAWYLQLLAALPFATVSVAQAPLWAGAAGIYGGLLLVMQLPWSLRLMGVPLMLPVLLWQAPRPPEGQFELLAADIGQGNAVLVRTATHTLVYDAGPRFSRESDAGHRVLVPLLRALDLRVDMLMLSHRDSDHVGGAQAVLAMHPRAELVSSIEDDHELQTVRRATRCIAGQRWRWDGVDFEVLHPSADDYEAGNKTNAMSCTLRISNGVQAALLAGDIEQAQEARLVGVGATAAAPGRPKQGMAPSGGSAAHAVASVGATVSPPGRSQGETAPSGGSAVRVATSVGASLKADVLLVPHHGSKTSSSAAFLDAVQPQIALVQAGYRNRFGHPAEPVLVRYAERHIRVVDSPHCGAAIWQSAQPQDVQCQRQQGLRYWHHRVP